MSKKLFSISSFIVLFLTILTMTSNVSFAVTCTWYNTLGNQRWEQSQNWDYGVPGSLDRAYINMTGTNSPVISDGVSATVQRVYLGRTANGDLLVSGGKLAVTDMFYNGYSGYSGTLEITSGTIIVSNKLVFGYTSGHGYLNVKGGLVKVSGMDLPAVGGGTSHLQLDDGQFICEGPYTINAGGTGDVTEGRLLLNGNVASLSGFSGWGVPGALIFTYDSGANKTTITADPNVAPIAHQPYPANASTGISPYVVLTWLSGYSAAEHDVYFGETWEDVESADVTTIGIYKGRQDVNSYNAGSLESLQLNRTYYWRIDEVNGSTIWPGRVWSFTTDDGKARQPEPSDGAAGINREMNKLGWTAGPFSVSQDLFFGTSWNDVNDKQTPDAAGLAADANDCLIPSSFLPLEGGKTYYWRIDSNNGPLSMSKGDIWSFTTAAYNDITFFALADLHYVSVPSGNAAQTSIVDNMNALPGSDYPVSVGGGKVHIPRGVLTIGDLVDDAQDAEWVNYTADYGVNGEGRINYPVYEGYGNHDYHGGRMVALNGIINRNPLRPYVTNISANGLHYSWDWDSVHFICLNVFPGNTQGTAMTDPKYSYDFVVSDLQQNVGTSGRPVVIMHHFGYDSWGFSCWPGVDQDAFYNVIKNYNVIGIFWGHTHSSTRINWLGIDTFNVGCPGGSYRTFTVVHIKGSSMTVINYTDGTWGSGINMQKTISLPLVNSEDLQNFSSQWLQEGVSLEADLNGDGRVDYKDFGIFAGYWLKGIPAGWPL